MTAGITTPLPVSSEYRTYHPSGSITRICVLAVPERLMISLPVTTPDQTTIAPLSEPELNAARLYETGPHERILSEKEDVHPVEVTQYSCGWSEEISSVNTLPLWVDETSERLLFAAMATRAYGLFLSNVRTSLTLDISWIAHSRSLAHSSMFSSAH